MTIGAALVAMGTVTAWTPHELGAQSEAEDVEATEPDQEVLVREMAIVWFGFDSARLTRAARRTLDAIADDVKARADGVVVVEGHACPLGYDDYNLDLGQRRAANVRNYLVARGVPSNSIQTVSHGEHHAISAVNQPNRRVVIRPQARQVVPEPERPELAVVTIGPPAAPTPPVLPAPTVRPPVPEPEPAPAPVPAPTDRPEKPSGFSVGIGAGVVGFLDGETRDFSDPGGMWEVRVAYGTRSWVAVEAAYNGSAQNIDALGLDSSAVLLGNGIEGTMRVNLTKERAIQPYGFAGFGYTYYSVENADFNTSDVKDSGDTLRLPFGLGVGYRLGDFRLDLRGTIRQSLGEESGLTSGLDAESSSFDSWSADLKIGWEF